MVPLPSLMPPRQTAEPWVFMALSLATPRRVLVWRHRD
jgi:hypothetical protein